jgi:tripartite-type tricarboxylate transporter receptor subunit TctC
MLRRLALIFAALFAVLAPAAASAQTFPVRPIKIVVPFPPGGSSWRTAPAPAGTSRWISSPALRPTATR